MSKAILGACLLLALHLGCAPPASPAKVLLIGIDGLEWSVLEPLLRQGRVPHIERLVKSGVHGRLETIDPTRSPVIWTTIATGRDREQHGILDFARPDQTSLYRSTDRRCKAFWNIASEHGLDCHVIGWWITYPAEEVSGSMVSQYTSSEQLYDVWKGALVPGLRGQTWPVGLLERIEPILGQAGREAEERMEKLFGHDPDRLPDAERRLAERLVRQSRWSFRADHVYYRVAEELLRENPSFDVFAVYLGVPDVVGHRFWRFYKPGQFLFRPSDAAVEAFEDVIPKSYEYVDEAVGTLVGLAGADANVFLVSDHGMHAYHQDLSFDFPDPEAADCNSGHHFPAARAPGVLIAAGPAIRAGPERAEVDFGRIRRVGSVYQITPTILYLLGLPAAEDMKSGPLTAMLTREFQEGHRLEWISSYETAGWRPPVVEVAGPGEATEAEMWERVQQIGYVGDRKSGSAKPGDGNGDRR